jgi:hypothetical protein
MELEVTPAFPTLIGRLLIPDADAMNQDLQALIIAEESEYASLGHSNIGGWHSRTDFLNRPEPAVSALTAWLKWARIRTVHGPASITWIRERRNRTGRSAVCWSFSTRVPVWMR